MFQKSSASVRKLFRTAVSAAVLVSAALWAGPAAALDPLVAQAGGGTCPPCPSQGFLTGSAGYAVRWLLVIALFVLTSILAFALGRSRKRAEQS